eukprot:TRINITY_DN5354_c0_g1_i2.p1 TRINITY_DN5354_c0_g1~~TRINITY_DN5354_c0_g1_i2.p1  ORF type:complete len:323 (+),score=76.00 TRINITY_DN5354_c0_g1_i2:1125-2093(+)
MIRSNSSSNFLGLALGPTFVAQKSSEEIEKSKLKTIINEEVENIRKIPVGSRNKHFVWEKVLELIKRVEDFDQKNFGSITNDTLPSSLRFFHNQLYSELIQKGPKNDAQENIKEEGTNEDSDAFVWDWNLLGMDVLKTVFSYIPFDDGNWLSLMRVNRIFYKVAKDSINPNKYYHGEKPIIYSTRKKQLESLRNLLMDERVDVSGAPTLGEPKITFRRQKTLPELAVESGWIEGFELLIQSDKIDWKRFNFEECEVFTHGDVSEMYTKYLLSKRAGGKTVRNLGLIKESDLEEILKRDDLNFNGSDHTVELKRNLSSRRVDS